MAEHIVCFIITARRPYKYDINQILGLPCGLPNRTRWRECWVSQRLQGVASLKDTIGKNALFILRDPETEYLYPLRWAEIKNAMKISDVYYFEHHVWKYFAYSESSGAINSEIKDFNKTLKKHHSDYFDKNPDNRWYVFLSNINIELGESPYTESYEELTSWGAVIRSIAEVKGLEGDEFLKLISISTLGEHNERVKKGFIELGTNTLYSLNLFQQIPQPISEPPEPHYIDFIGPNEHFAVLKQKQPALGKYDAISFNFRTLNSSSKEFSFIEIKSNPPNNDQPGYHSSLFLPILIKPRYTFFSLLKLVLAILLLCLVISPDLLSWNQENEELVRSFSIISFSILASGRLVSNSMLSRIPKIN